MVSFIKKRISLTVCSSYKAESPVSLDWSYEWANCSASNIDIRAGFKLYLDTVTPPQNVFPLGNF